MNNQLDSTELLEHALDRMNAGRDGEAVDLLVALLESEPTHVHAQYLLAAQLAQMGLFEQAEVGLRAVVAQAPDYDMARFQLGQMLLLKGALPEAQDTFGPLLPRTDAVGAFARGLCAAGAEDVPTAMREFESGLALPQENQALAHDMSVFLEKLRASVADEQAAFSPAVSSMLLASYRSDR